MIKNNIVEGKVANINLIQVLLMFNFVSVLSWSAFRICSIISQDQEMCIVVNKYRSFCLLLYSLYLSIFLLYSVGPMFFTVQHMYYIFGIYICLISVKEIFHH